MPVNGRKNEEHCIKRRNDCLQYAKENYPEWPKPYSTWHTGVCHFGYGWHQEKQNSPWHLMHYKTKDMITKEDVTDHKQHIPEVTEIWVRFDSTNQIAETSVIDKSIEKDWIKFSPVSQ
jgi:hypothetical protein